MEASALKTFQLPATLTCASESGCGTTWGANTSLSGAHILIICQGPLPSLAPWEALTTDILTPWPWPPSIIQSNDLKCLRKGKQTRTRKFNNDAQVGGPTTGGCMHTAFYLSKQLHSAWSFPTPHKIKCSKFSSKFQVRLFIGMSHVNWLLNCNGTIYRLFIVSMTVRGAATQNISSCHLSNPCEILAGPFFVSLGHLGGEVHPRLQSESASEDCCTTTPSWVFCWNILEGVAVSDTKVVDDIGPWPKNTVNSI